MTKKILGPQEFKELEEDIQLTLLHNDGVHVGKRKLHGKTLILFQLYSFYVEILYKEYRKKIYYMLVSADTEMLQPYLDQIHVRDLQKHKGKD
jgi:hypothetical protein